MKRIKIAALVMLVVISLVGCASNKEPEPRELEAKARTDVIEHKGSALGINQLPMWVETYISSGVAGLEKMPDFQGSYCFIGETVGSNLNAVQTWASSFDAQSSIASTVSTRVETLFTGSANGSPEGEYGSYYENVVRTASSATYSGARKVNDWWVFVRRYDGNRKTGYTDEYRAYVMYTIAKDVLDEQILTMMDNVAKNTKDTTSAQQRAISNVRALMASEGFTD